MPQHIRRDPARHDRRRGSRWARRSSRRRRPRRRWGSRSRPVRRRLRRYWSPWRAARRSSASWARPCRSRGPMRRRDTACAGSTGRRGRRSRDSCPSKAQCAGIQHAIRRTGHDPGLGEHHAQQVGLRLDPHVEPALEASAFQGAAVAVAVDHGRFSRRTRPRSSGRCRRGT